MKREVTITPISFTSKQKMSGCWKHKKDTSHEVSKSTPHKSNPNLKVILT